MGSLKKCSAPLPLGRVEKHEQVGAGFLAYGFLLPTPSRTMSSGLKTGKRLEAGGLRLKDEIATHHPCLCLGPRTLLLIPALLWVSFRLQLRGSDGFTPPSLPSRAISKSPAPPPLVSSLSEQHTVSSLRSCGPLMAECLFHLHPLAKDCQFVFYPLPTLKGGARAMGKFYCVRY